MRLICPKCGAQYEVDEAVIPASGRDVQCSGCGQTWFQPSAQMIAAGQSPDAEAPDAPEAWEATSSPRAAPASPGSEAAPEPASSNGTDYDEDYELPVPPAAFDWPEETPAPTPDAPSEAEPETPPPPAIEPQAGPDQAAQSEARTEAAIAAVMRGENPAPDLQPTEPPPAPADPGSPYVTEPLPQAVAAERAPAMRTADLGPAPRVGVVPRRAIDENLLAILREEAEREAAARQAEGQVFETQEEMNLAPADRPGATQVTAAPDPRATPDAPPPEPAPSEPSPPEPAPPEPAAAEPPARPRIVPQKPQRPARQEPDFSDLNSADAAEMDDAEEDHDASEEMNEGLAALNERATRRQRLPDIEEINSTLRASADRGRDPAAIRVTQRGARGSAGFRFGFSLVVVIAAGLAAVYIFAPRIAKAVPELQPALVTYVALADTARLWLDESLRAVIEQLGDPAS